MLEASSRYLSPLVGC